MKIIQSVDALQKKLEALETKKKKEQEKTKKILVKEKALKQKIASQQRDQLNPFVEALFKNIDLEKTVIFLNSSDGLSFIEQFNQTLKQKTND